MEVMVVLMEQTVKIIKVVVAVVLKVLIHQVPAVPV